jgi:hypothetical protein
MKRALLGLMAVLALVVGLAPVQPALANTETLTIVQNTNGVHQATIAGVITPADTVTITVHDAALSGGQKSISTNVNSGDTFKKIARRLSNRINADSDVESIGVSAVHNESVVTLLSTSTNTTSYTASANPGATETVALSVNTNPVTNAALGGALTPADELRIIVHDVGIPSGQRRIRHVIQAGDTLQSIAVTMADELTNRNALDKLGISATAAGSVVTITSYSPNSTTYTSRVIGAQTETIAFSVNQNTRHNIIVGGSVTVGDVVAFVVSDAGLSAGQKTVSYTVQTGDDLSAVAAGLAGAVNADADLSGIGVTADSTGTPVVNLSSNSVNATTYQVAPAAPSVTCVEVKTNPSQWPAAAATKVCTGASPALALKMRQTLEAIGNLPYDAASRLKTEAIQSGEMLAITVKDVTAGNQTLGTANYTTVGSDSPVTITSRLAVELNGISNVNAVASGDVINVFSGNGNVLELTVQNGQGVTITPGPQGTSTTASIAGAPRANITWYLFKTHQDFYNSTSANGGPPNYAARPSPTNNPLPNDALGYSTTLDLDPGPGVVLLGYTVVFEQSPLETNKVVAHTTAHETGHHLDLMYGRAFVRGNNTRYSGATAFEDALTRDVDAMRHTPPCRFDARDDQDPPHYASSGTTDPEPNSPNGEAGLFTAEDDTYGNKICAGTGGAGWTTVPAYPNTWDSVQIITGNGEDIRAAYPLIQTLDTPPGDIDDAELFAEEASFQLGFSDLVNNSGADVPGSDTVIQNVGAFVCTQLSVATLLVHGREPLPSELTTRFYIVPLPLGTGIPADPKGPNFEIRRCSGSPEQGTFGPYGG